MTILLMIENLIRMILQTIYNFISCILQTLSLIPICLVFLLTSRLKCCLCGGGGHCNAGRSGNCIMSAFVILVVFLILRATGLLDKILGCAKPTSLYSPPPTDKTAINESVLSMAAALAKRITDAKTSTKLPDDINKDLLRNLIPGEGIKGYFPDYIKDVLRNVFPGEGNEGPLPDGNNDVLGSYIPVEDKDLRNDDNSVDIDVDITRHTNADENNDGKVADTRSNIESTTFWPKLSTVTNNTKLISFLRYTPT